MKRHPENDPVRLQHMLEATEKAIQFSQGRTLADLDNDEMFALAVVRLIEIIGEAATHVSEPTRQAYPAVVWQDISDMRNRVIHGYYDIDHQIVWDTLSRNLPLLRDQLVTIIQAINKRQT
jgi:uncharacterized protein with HEPN domain